MEERFDRPALLLEAGCARPQDERAVAPFLSRRNGRVGLVELGGGALDAGGAINTASYTQTGGTLTGVANLTVSGATALSGGIMSGADARAKIEAGASLVQFYTGLVYRGPVLVPEVAQALRA